MNKLSKLIGLIFLTMLIGTTAQAGRIADKIENHVITTFKFDPELTQVNCRPAIDSLMLTDSTEIIVSCREYPIPKGYFPLKVILQNGSGEVKSISTSVEIKFYQDVLLAKRKLKSRTSLSQLDFVFERVEVNNLVGEAVEDFNEVDGMRASKTISKGKILTRNMLEPIPIIKKGERVRIVYKSANLKIESYGIARKNAVAGEMVEVKNTASGKKIYGRAESAGIVMVEN